MSGPIAVPPAPEMERTLGGLFDRPVQVKEAGREPPNPPWAVSIYRPASGGTVACLCELPLACGAGALLSLLPPAAATESAAAGRMSEALLQNFREVMNVLAHYLSGGGERVVLERIVAPPEMAPPALLRRALTSRGRLDVEVELPGYAGGRLSFAAF